MNEKAKSIMYYVTMFLMCGIGIFSLMRSSMIVEKSIKSAENSVNRSLYLNLSDDESKSLEMINTIKDDYYYKAKDTGYWKMITNENQSINDKVFIVNISSYAGNSKSEEYADRFANYLKTWFNFEELEDDWTDRSDQIE